MSVTNVYGFDRSRSHLDETERRNDQELSLELGGNAPFIVFDDADLDVCRQRKRSLQSTVMLARPVSVSIDSMSKPEFTTLLRQN